MGNPELPTPFLILDLDIVEDRYRELRAALPTTTILYAVKANPHEEVIRLLAAAGASFDVASPGEIDLCLRCGIPPSRLSYGNTIKKDRDIALAFASGVRTFVVDAGLEVRKVLRHAPESTVFVRISTDGAGADWPLSRKFGCSTDEALPLLRTASRAGHPVGISFHVGSQQRNPDAWRAPLNQVAQLKHVLAGEDIALVGVNLGGGLPSSYLDPMASIGEYGTAIRKAVDREIGGAPPRLFVEPGRYLVGDAGRIEAEVVLIAERSGARWAYLDIGLFNGLAETLGEAIRYRIRVPDRSGRVIPTILAGPTCDSADVLYERTPCLLPADLAIGDRVELLSTGAYTASYSTVGFNGFEPLRSYVVRGRHGADPSSRRTRLPRVLPGPRLEPTAAGAGPR